MGLASDMIGGCPEVWWYAPPIDMVPTSCSSWKLVGVTCMFEGQFNFAIGIRLVL